MKFFIVLTTFVLLGASGCGPQGVTEKRFSNPAPDAIDRAAALIQGYAEVSQLVVKQWSSKNSLRVLLPLTRRKEAMSKSFLPKLKRRDVSAGKMQQKSLKV